MMCNHSVFGRVSWFAPFQAGLLLLSVLLTGCGGDGSSNLTNSPNSVNDPTRLLFQTSIKPLPGIDTLKTDGTGLARMMDNGSFPQQPRFSSDRSKIVSVVGSGVTHLVVMNGDGSNPVNLPNPAGVISVALPYFRSDGNALVFEGDGALYTNNLAGTAPQKLPIPTIGRLSHPVYTPDGTQIVFVRETEVGTVGINADLWIASADGRNARFLTNDASSTQPAVSPDGARIAFVYQSGGHSEIRTMALNGGDVRQIVNTKEMVSAPVYSPDGNSIAFLRLPDAASLSTIARVSVNGGSAVGIGTVQVDGGTLDWR